MSSKSNPTKKRDDIIALERENADLKARIDVIESVNKWKAGSLIFVKAIPWVGTVFISYFIYLSVVALAGKETNANIIAFIFANINVGHAVAAVLGGGGAIYGLAQKRLKERTVEKLHRRIKDLEEKVDPDRTTSGLTSRGNTNPLDRF